MLKHKTKTKRTAPSDSATLRTKPTKFNPDQEYLDRAKRDFLKKGGKIKLVVPDYEECHNCGLNPYRPPGYRS